MKVTVKLSQTALRFDEVPVKTFYQIGGLICYKLSENEYLEFGFGGIALQTMNATGVPNRTVLPAGSKIEITV